MYDHRTGKRDKPALALCHGYSDNGLCWTPVARALENEYDVLMPDARGHGLSDAPLEGNNAEGRADDVAAFIKALNLTKPAVLGHSMGAATAAAVAAKYPALVSKVLLEDPSWWDEGSQRHQMTDKGRKAWAKQRKEKLLQQKIMSRHALAETCRVQSPYWSEQKIGP